MVMTENDVISLKCIGHGQKVRYAFAFESITTRVAIRENGCVHVKIMVKIKLY